MASPPPTRVELLDQRRGTSFAAAATKILSKGACLAQPREPSPTRSLTFPIPISFRRASAALDELFNDLDAPDRAPARRAKIAV